jgi:predicted protein tyrosine phosphatase
MSTRAPSIVITPYQFLSQTIQVAVPGHAVSILGDSDRLEWPDLGAIPTLRLRFDDIHAPARGWIPPGYAHIAQLIDFGQRWKGLGTVLVHCRAGSSRSPAAAIILAAILNHGHCDDLVRRVATARAYFRPHVGMLALADRMLQRRSSLVDLVRSLPRPVRTDVWGAIAVPLELPTAPEPAPENSA